MNNIQYRILKLLSLVFILFFVLKLELSYAALNYQETYQSQINSNKIILVLVNSSIYSSIEASLKQYVEDVEAEGWKAIISKFISGTAVEVRNYFKTISGLKGVLLVGDLPHPWFEMKYVDGYYDKYGSDIFYMDLTGNWTDTDKNNIFDDYSYSKTLLIPEQKPEIWVGRLTASPLVSASMNEVMLIKNYFLKNHNYRTVGTNIIQRALAYPDDDWSYWKDCSLGSIYSDVTVINDKTKTVASDYKLRLKENYEWIQVCVHSSHDLHAFKNKDINGKDIPGGDVWTSDIPIIDPSTLFYNLFACGNTKYTYSQYMGGQYAFAKTNGLLVIGTTKSGGMHTVEKFYPYLGKDYRNLIGEAYLKWFNSWSFDADNRFWFYGMTIIGDPTLSLNPPRAIIDSVSAKSIVSGQIVAFKGSGQINNLSGDKIVDGQWRSNKDGILAKGLNFQISSLSVGEHVIYFKVLDNKGRWSSESKVNITVTKSNNTAPVVESKTLTTKLNKRLDLTLTASDLDKDPLKISIASIPSNGKLFILYGSNPIGNNRYVLYMPNQGFVGTDSFTYKANDGKADSSLGVITIQVINNVNQPPVLDKIADMQVLRNAKVAIVLKAKDPENDTVKFIGNGLPTGSSFSALKGILNWKATKVGVYNLEFTAVDSKGAKSEKMTVKITVK